MKTIFRNSLIYVFSLVLLSHLMKLESAIIVDADIQGKNGLALKQYAMVLKALPAAPGHHANLVATDTDELIKGIGTDNSAYIAFAKKGIKTALKTWIETVLLAAGNNKFLSSKGPGGGMPDKRPATFNRNDFIAKLDTIIDGTATVALAPADAKLASLKAARTAILDEFVAEVTIWITTSLMAVNGAGFVNGTVAVGGATDLVDRSRDEFIAAITRKIQSF